MVTYNVKRLIETDIFIYWLFLLKDDWTRPKYDIRYSQTKPRANCVFYMVCYSFLCKRHIFYGFSWLIFKTVLSNEASWQYVSVKLVTITVQVLLWQEYHDQSARETIRLQVRLPRTGSGDATRHSGPCRLQVPVRPVHVQLPPFHQAELHEPTCRHPFVVRWVALLVCPNTSRWAS